MVEIIMVTLVLEVSSMEFIEVLTLKWSPQILTMIPLIYKLLTLESEGRDMHLREVQAVPRFLNKNATKFPINSPGDSAAQWTNHHVIAVQDKFTNKNVQMWQ